MATIHITRYHQLDNQTVSMKVQALADKLADDLSAKYKWEKDRLTFKRSGASGFILMRDGELKIEIKLGMLLIPLKSTIEKTVSNYLDEELA